MIFLSVESQEWRGILWEDAEAEERVQPNHEHPGDDQEERKEQTRAAASDAGSLWEKVCEIFFIVSFEMEFVVQIFMTSVLKIKIFLDHVAILELNN